MRDAHKMSRYGILFTARVVCSLLLLCGAGCASSDDRQLMKKYSRVGESATVSNSREGITEAIALWSRTLTNGYMLYEDNNTRGHHTSLRADPATLFMLRNRSFGIGFWGKSACLPPEKSSYWAEVIIRLRSVSTNNQVSV